ncbi:MAG: hypothetical protein KJ583_01695 [Nanoarchaeota archaeon]|nr:hypothetical protein [Nanoarchaeota archaeon]MBU1269704.1 hypothetical protein [Nanoarchaeota archaeon]MBU1604005.1 hypothetical protein [Nanoarchaeota archaeon]MBU2442522.1 hypothetical protein [Nanoarchaeota archaeon]
MAQTMLGGALSFMNDLGIYDVVLPFLLVFTIVFAILEKTKIFGVEDFDGHKITRKNMNAMTAFVMAFFVVGSAKLVGLINQVASQVFLLMLLFVLFLMLAGVLQKDGEYELASGWKKALMGIAFTVIVLIFLNAIGWLEDIYEFLTNYWDTQAVSTVITLIFIGLFIFWITKSPAPTKKAEKGD